MSVDRSHYKKPRQRKCGHRPRAGWGDMTRAKDAIAAAYLLWEERQGIRARTFRNFTFGNPRRAAARA